MPELTISVIGTPVPQGSKVANRFGHGVRDANAKKLKPWRAEVAGTVLDAMTAADWVTLDEPTEVVITFFHKRLDSHFGTGRNAGKLKPSAPSWKSTKPDIDKLTRAILDALTDSAAIRDDGRIARLVVEDRYADAATGARITITSLTPDTPESPAGVSGPHVPAELASTTRTAATTPDARQPVEGGGRPATVQEALL